MKDYICLEIEFLFGEQKEPSNLESQKLHSHLSFDNNSVLLKIYFNSYLEAYKFLSKSNYLEYPNDIGQYFKVVKISDNELFQSIDFKSCSIIEAQASTNFFENNSHYVLIKLSGVNIYEQPNPEMIGTGTAILDLNGFFLVKDYFSDLFVDSSSQISIRRMSYANEEHFWGDISISPAFHLGLNKIAEGREVRVNKMPMLKLRFSKESHINDILDFIEKFTTLASFYFHIPIGCQYIEIHTKHGNFKKYRFGDVKSNVEPSSFLFLDESKSSFSNFFEFIDRGKVEKSWATLKESIQLYLYSFEVKSNSRYLILFNVIELFSASSENKKYPKFQFIGGKKSFERQKEKALEMLLKVVHNEDQTSFINKWSGVSSKLVFLPLKSPLETYLIEQGFESQEIEKYFKVFKEARDKLTHGGNKYSKPQIDRANQSLMKLVGKLILNNILIEKPLSMDFDSFKLDVFIK